MEIVSPFQNNRKTNTDFFFKILKIYLQAYFKLTIYEK
jgi:hypothetical protein